MNPPSKRKLLVRITDDIDYYIAIECTIIGWPSFSITIN